MHLVTPKVPPPSQYSYHVSCDPEGPHLLQSTAPMPLVAPGGLHSLGFPPTSVPPTLLQKCLALLTHCVRCPPQGLCPRASPGHLPWHTHSMYLPVLKSFMSTESHLDMEASLLAQLLSLLSLSTWDTFYFSPWWCATEICYHLLCSVWCYVGSTWLRAWSVGARLLRRSQLELSSSESRPEAVRVTESFHQCAEV